MGREDVDPTMQRLDSQIDWYDRESRFNKVWYEVLKGIELVAAAAIPLSALLAPKAWIAAALGVGVVVLESVLQLKQLHASWISYRSTCEALRHEKYLYLGLAGPYAGASDAHALLAARVEETVSREHAKWVDTHSREPPRG